MVYLQSFLTKMSSHHGSPYSSAYMHDEYDFDDDNDDDLDDDRDNDEPDESDEESDEAEVDDTSLSEEESAHLSSSIQAEEFMRRKRLSLRAMESKYLVKMEQMEKLHQLKMEYYAARLQQQKEIHRLKMKHMELERELRKKLMENN